MKNSWLKYSLSTCVMECVSCVNCETFLSNFIVCCDVLWLTRPFQLSYFVQCFMDSTMPTNQRRDKELHGIKSSDIVLYALNCRSADSHESAINHT